ncbi:MAG: S1 RNA-binding domain-containing protein [Planctomycetota bacterium]|nr:S1 RNA-binding domain-containing protein [Planctomycetota bacterium]
MPKNRLDEKLKEKFRPNADAKLEEQVDAALADISIDELYAFDKPQPGASANAAEGARLGTIVRIDKDDVMVDFGGKSQGIISLIQFEEEPKVGQQMEFNVDRYDASEGLLILSRKGATATNVTWETLEVGQIVEGTVTAVNKGGLEVAVKSMRAFMPAGQVDVYHVPDLTQFIDQKVTAEVMAFEREGRNIVLSRRNVMERQRQEQKEKLLGELAEGQVRRGTVRSVMDFGAFVDLGGVDGLLHVSEMSFRRVRNPGEIVKVGDVLDVKVLKIDRTTGKLSLSLKQALGTDPWSDAETKYKVGTPVTGRVTKVESFGAFIEVEEGVEGLLPISEMSYRRIRSASDVVKEGDTVRLVTISLDTLARRMSFSLKQAGPDPWSTVHERYTTDSIVQGTVSRVVDFGAFVEIEEGLEGLIHISELSDKQIRSAGDAVKQGQSVNVQILEIDKEGRRISLSLKRAAYMTPAASTTIAPVATGKAKKRPELRGGLDH